MHLVINATEIGRQRGGNEAYLWGLLEGLDEIVDQCPHYHIELLVTEEGAHAVQSRFGSNRFSTVNVGRYWRLWFYLAQQTTHLYRVRPDWYLSTFFLPCISPASGAVLVHDMSFRSHPEYFPVTIAAYMRILTGLAIRQATLVIALSEFTRQEIIRFHPAVADKITVIYPGVSGEFAPRGQNDETVIQQYRLCPGYILAVGNVHPRKNLVRVLDAFEQLRAQQGRSVSMVWVGHQRWGSNAVAQRARHLGVQMIGFVPQEHLPAIYRQAGVLVYPSLYEGFGLPLIEAMACGLPVVASCSTALPEAVGEAGVLVDTRDVRVLADALARVLFDTVLRQQLRERGLAWVQRFKWSETARKLLHALDSAALR